MPVDDDRRLFRGFKKGKPAFIHLLPADGPEQHAQHHAAEAGCCPDASGAFQP